MPALEGLTDRERVLVEARLRGMTIAGAAAAAGYAYAHARELLNEPHCQAALALGRKISAEATAITRERLTDMLLEAYRAAANSTEMTLAVRELAKLHGLNAPQKVEIDHSHRLATVTHEQHLKQLSVADLERIANLRGGEIIEGELVPPRLTQDVPDAQEA